MVLDLRDVMDSRYCGNSPNPSVGADFEALLPRKARQIRSLAFYAFAITPEITSPAPR